MKIAQKFVEYIPDQVEEGILYISIEYCTAIHKCMCGCGNEVVTPLSPTDWELTFDGRTVSLYPSIGNWNFKCKSHYWIKHSTIEFAGRWTEMEIRSGRENDLKSKQTFYEEKEKIGTPILQEEIKVSLWRKLLNLLEL